MEKKISKNQKMYPHRFGCSQNHPKAPKNPIVALLGDFGYSQNSGGTFSDFLIFFFSMAISPHNHKLKSESGGIIP